MSYLSQYIQEKGADVAPEMVAYLASIETVSKVDSGVAQRIIAELRDQRSYLKMIASENYSSLATQLSMGNLLTDKYAEGFPHHRFYAGCDNVDDIEAKAVSYAKELFGADHAYVQAHSGADANMLAYWVILSKKIQEPALEKLGITDPSKLSTEDWNSLRAELGNQKLIGLNYYSGGHLTHGYRHNVSARMFDCICYDVDPETELLDYDKLRDLVLKEKPLIFLAGYSAYPRKINFKKLKEIADEAGSVFMVDMAHFAGLVAGKVFSGDFDPVAHADMVTSTTHKTLRGPRGGLVLCKEEYAEWVDKGCPLVLGGPLPHVMAAKAIAFKEANSPEFQAYAQRIVDNSQALAEGLTEAGVRLTSGGTDNHLMVADIRSFNLTGRQAENALREAKITLNRNSIPFDPNGAWYTSGLRLGTAALTSRGFDTDDMREIAKVVYLVLSNTKANIMTKGDNAGKPSKAKYTIDADALKEAQSRVEALLSKHELYPELDLEWLEKAAQG
jgi:glycine hydroxymethyltransferase